MHEKLVRNRLRVKSWAFSAKMAAAAGVAEAAGAGASVHEDNNVNALTADEAEQYDRQIRLWGLEAQKR